MATRAEGIPILYPGFPEHSRLEEDRLGSMGELNGGDMSWVHLYPFVFQAIPIPNGRMLDVGSNDARFARWLSSQHIKRDVVSLDIRDIKIRDENLVRGSGRALPFKDKSFRSLVSLFALPMFCGNNVKEEDVLGEMARVTTDRIIIWPPPLERWVTQWIGDCPSDDQINRDVINRAAKLTGVDWDIKVVDLSIPGSMYKNLNKVLVIANASYNDPVSVKI